MYYHMKLYILFLAVWTVTRDTHLARHLLSQANSMGQLREPLLHVDAIDCPPDILHMRKAVYTKLLDQIVTFSIAQKHQDKLLQEMTRIGINFRYNIEFPNIFFVCFYDLSYAFIKFILVDFSLLNALCQTILGSDGLLSMFTNWTLFFCDSELKMY